MASAIGHILPIAVAVAFSSIPIIAAILILLSPTPPIVSVFYLVGFAVGVFAVLLALSLSVAILPTGATEHPELWQGVAEMVLGALLAGWAVVSWLRERRRSADPQLPKWMAMFEHLNVFTATGVGFVLALRPKNLLLSVAAAVVVGTAGLAPSGSLIVIGLYTVLAVSTVAIPVVGYLVLGRRMASRLESLRGWIVRNNHAVTSAVLLLTGVVIFGAGLARL